MSILPRLVLFGAALTLLSACILQARASAQSSAAVAPPPRELGRVHWRSELEAALQHSKATTKPVLLLFQEIPG